MKRCLNLILSLCIMLSAMPITLVSVAAEEYDESLQPGGMGYKKQVMYDEYGNVVETDGRLKPDTSFNTMSESTLPSSYDARSKSLVTPVKNQGASNNCWTFAATSVLETNSIVNGYTQLSATDFSEPHLAWFSYNTLSSDKRDPNCGEGFSLGSQVYNQGGNNYDITRALSRWAGVADGSKVSSNYPTTASQLSKLPNYTDDDRFDTSSGVIISSMEKCTTADEVKQWILDNGSITASYYHSNSSDYIKNGSNYVAYCYTGDDISSTNHMIAVVGWDDSYSASKFNSKNKPEGNGAWLCKNSWGSGWGNGKGYFWISYYDKTISDFYGYTTQPADKFDNNYTFNGSGFDSLWNTVKTSATIANVFTARYSEELTAIATYTQHENVTAKVRIYKNISSGETNDPTNGELVQSFTVNLSRIGYHTIDLPEAVQLEHGCVFSVVFDLSIPSGYLLIPMEEGDGNTSVEGQSLIFKDNSWYTTQIVNSYKPCGNLCIQAFSVTTCDHINQETVIKKYDDCYNQGYERVICKDCNGVVSEILFPMKDHTPGEWKTEKETSCKEAGLSVRRCAVCNQILESKEIAKLEHIAGDWETISEASCTKTGYAVKDCAVCGSRLETQTLPMKDHSPGDWAVERVTTCTVAGILAKKCTECSLILETQDIPVTGHSPGDWEVKVATNCQREGTLAKLCTTCGVTLESQKIPMVDHDYIYSVVTNPTCIESGVGIYTCSMCRQFYEESIEPTGEHTYSKWELVKAPTSTEDGEKKHTCNGCSMSEIVVIKATGFEIREGTSVDYLTGVISGIRAGETSLETYVEIIDEKYTWEYENGGRLGTGTKAFLKNGDEIIGEYTVLLYGDVNGDGWYDGEDAVLVNCLANKMLNKDSLPEVCYTAADCNHNGYIDSNDIKILNEAGLLLASVDQTKTADILFETSSAYSAYIDIIDQSPEEGISEDNIGNETVTESESTEISSDIFEVLVGLIIRLFNMILKILVN